jgi:hypothetical protein
LPELKSGPPGTLTLRGGKTVRRLGFGSMRLTGKGVSLMRLPAWDRRPIFLPEP